MNEQIPSIGRIVHYRLSADDAAQINRRRAAGRNSVELVTAQVHVGNMAAEGDTFPMLITRAWGSTPTAAVNGQVMLDGNDVLWATSVYVGEGPRTFSWPTRV